MRCQQLIFAFTCLLALPLTARANGVYMPQRANRLMPTIPQQQAIIVHRNNTETLIVESAFQTDSPQVAWILPLPAPPSKLELGEPGEISAALYAAGPAIIHDLHYVSQVPSIVFICIIPLAAITIFTRGAARRSWIRAACIIIFFTFFLSAILLPSLGGPGAATASPAGVTIQSAHRLGGADFTTLTAKTPAALSQWLEEQSLRPLDPAAQVIVQDYIAHHWCFVVGRLTSSPNALNLPRPLIATFPTKDPVFPMKLTALANSSTHVELFIIADQQAAAPNFHLAIADRMQILPASPPTDWRPGRSALASAPFSAFYIGSPDVVPLMWPYCVVTKLTADLAPAAMDHDIVLTMTNHERPHRDAFYTSLARGQIALAVLLSGLSLWLILAAFIAKGRRTPPLHQLRLLLYLLTIILFAATITWLAISTIPVRVESHRHFARSRIEDLSKISQTLAAQGLIHADMKPEELLALPQLMLDKKLCTPETVLNPYTGILMRPERSPGNFSIRTIDGIESFCLYDSTGMENWTPLTPLPTEK